MRGRVAIGNAAEAHSHQFLACFTGDLALCSSAYSDMLQGEVNV